MDFTTAFAMQTLHGNPVSIAAARAVLDTIAREKLAENATLIGGYLISELQALQGRHSCIGNVRGRGLMIGVELVSDHVNKTPSKMLTAKIVYRAFELGLVVYYVGMNSNILELTPPLVLSKAEALQAVDILDRAISDVENGFVSDDVIKDYVGW
jgi:4-aminobutyrate aminotransferase